MFGDKESGMLGIPVEMAFEKKDRDLKWVDCECGCRGSVTGVGSKTYWLDDDTADNYVVHYGHSHIAPCMGQYSSFEQACEAIREDARPELEVLRAQLKDAERIFG